MTTAASMPGPLPYKVGMPVEGRQGEILTPEACCFLAALSREFAERRSLLLKARQSRQASLDAGILPGFLSESEAIRAGNWMVAPVPPPLRDRRVEITGPAEAKTIINGLNSGAQVFMADFEDALSPTWANLLAGQVSLYDAVRGSLVYEGPQGRSYQLSSKPATLIVRPRGLHLDEKHFLAGDRPVPASLFDFGLFFFHNGLELLARGAGPYFYLPKLESHVEARLWNDIFHFAQAYVGMPRGTIRATVLIETLPAAFEMDEILFELRDHAAGLNAGRWDYLFSIIKKLSAMTELTFPDRDKLTMDRPFMDSYCRLLVNTCHRRAAHALGGMSAFIPSRRDPAFNEAAIAHVRRDKEREASMGFDGTWVAHPDLVPVACQVFDRVLQGRSDQKSFLVNGGEIRADQLLDFSIDQAGVSSAGVASNISVALQYFESWLGGQGACAINNLMEDAATAEIARSQLWQWLKRGASIDGASRFDSALYMKWREDELDRLARARPGRWNEAAALLDRLVLSEEFVEFFTLVACERLP